MKIRIFSIIFAAALMLCGCASTPSTSFTAYPGVSDVFQGHGGEMMPFDGIDFWINGDSDRKYKILGVIAESPKGSGSKHRLPLGRLSRVFSGYGNHDNDDEESVIAKAVHKQGGDAVVVVKINQDSTDMGDDGEENHHRQLVKYMVIKYVK